MLVSPLCSLVTLLKASHYLHYLSTFHSDYEAASSEASILSKGKADMGFRTHTINLPFSPHPLNLHLLAGGSSSSSSSNSSCSSRSRSSYFLLLILFLRCFFSFASYSLFLNMLAHYILTRTFLTPTYSVLPLEWSVASYLLGITERLTANLNSLSLTFSCSLVISSILRVCMYVFTAKY